MNCFSHGHTDGRNLSFHDKPDSSFVCVRCTDCPPDRLMDGNLASVISLARHLSVCIVLLVPQTDGRKPSFRDKSRSSFVCVRCTACPTDTRTDRNLPSSINLTRHLSVSVVLVVSQTDGNFARFQETCIMSPEADSSGPEWCRGPLLEARSASFEKAFFRSGALWLQV